MVFVSEECAKHIFYTEYPFVWPASLFFILGVFIPHIWVIDIKTKDQLQDIERSISYTWTNNVSRGLILIVAIYNHFLVIYGCYGSWSEYSTPKLMIILSWLIVFVAYVNNSNFTDIPENYYDEVVRYVKNPETGIFEEEDENHEDEEEEEKIESKPLLVRRSKRKEILPDRIVELRKVRKLRDKVWKEKVVSFLHKSSAFVTFTSILVISIFLIIGENEYNQPGNDQTLVLALFTTGCICLLVMILHLIIRSAVCVKLADKYIPSYSWNGVVSYFERMFTLCFILIVMGTPKENID